MKNENAFYHAKPGIDENIIREISKLKGEPKWMLDYRLKGLEIFQKKKMPSWGPDLGAIDFSGLTYYIKPSERSTDSWSQVPAGIKRTFDKLGIPEAEKKFLGGVGAQYDSEMVYHHLKGALAKKGVIFCDMDTAVKKYPESVKKYFATVVPTSDNKFAALNTAAWSGGSFIHVPEGVSVGMPLQAYFRINAEKAGQFERTLILAEPGSFVHYVEGCSAPIYSASSLHAAVVELVAQPGSTIRYTTIQNWSKNVYNLVTKRAFAYEGATVQWLDGNIGSAVSMKYPAVYLLGKGAHAEVLSIAFAGKGQAIDAGAKAIHLAPGTSSKITSKSLSKDGGRTTYRGLVHIAKGAVGANSSVRCEALILDDKSASDTIPTMDIHESRASIGHEAFTGRVSREQLFYLMSRGIGEDEALGMIVQGFVEPFVKELPLEYAVELNRLIELDINGSVG